MRVRCVFFLKSPERIKVPEFKVMEPQVVATCFAKQNSLFVKSPKQDSSLVNDDLLLQIFAILFQYYLSIPLICGTVVQNGQHKGI